MTGMSGLRYFSCFTGIGGFDLAADWLGWSRVGWCEMNQQANETFRQNFDSDGQAYYRDATKIAADLMPDFDVFVGGFPCQPFSSMGKQLGFYDVRGTLFFDIARIIKAKAPKAFLLENVPGLIGHDGGKTFRTMLSLLSSSTNGQMPLEPYVDSLNYHVFWSLLNSANFGVPQSRKRVYMVGFRDETNFEFPTGCRTTLRIKDILEEGAANKYLLKPSQRRVFQPGNNPNGESGITITMRSTRYDSETIVSEDGLSPTLKADGENCPPRISPQMRFLTPRECARLQGFPDAFKLHKSEGVAYSQLGNAVTVNTVRAIMEKVQSCLTG